MFYLPRIGIGFLVFVLVISCTSNKKIDIWPYGVKYEIFVLSFADSDGDGKGDLNGVTEKLDYLKDLGVNGIWLMPIMPSTSYHKYDVRDYKNIDPEYGTLLDFSKLVKEAHKRDIKIIIDMVLNHTAADHPWFKSASAGEDSAYHDFYVWKDLKSIQNEISKKLITLDSDNLTQWHTVNNDTTSELYYGFFSSQMPDLNFDNQKVRDAFVDIGRFWLDSMHVDGFRFDAARHIYPDDNAFASHEFWNWYKTELQKMKADVYLIGEVYSRNFSEVTYYTKGLPSLFNFYMGNAIINALDSGRNGGLINEYDRMINAYRNINPEYLDAPILTNHDQNRILSELRNDKLKARVAASILLTLPGAPFIYYGEELGMLGEKPDEHIREPFPWGDNATTKWIEPLTNQAHSLSVQIEDTQSLYAHYKKMIAYRNGNAILTFGDLKPINRLPKEIVGFMRTYKDKTVLVFHNVSPQKVSFSLEDDFIFYSAIDLTTNNEATLSDYLLTVPAYATVVVEK